jgi:propanediol dehydratase small subunit
MDPVYPLMDSESDTLRAKSGKSLHAITLDAALAGALQDEDLQIRAETLRSQAEIARSGGYNELAANLLRAAELTAVPNEELLQIYELLRPGRASFETLIALAEHLERTYGAALNAAFIREAAAAYQARGLLRRKR